MAHSTAVAGPSSGAKDGALAYAWWAFSAHTR